MHAWFPAFPRLALPTICWLPEGAAVTDEHLTDEELGDAYPRRRRECCTPEKGGGDRHDKNN
ncbi:hypothetical protein D6Z43_03960 [Pseudomonas sp. DY-1]|jgi:hypothetical protein|nr:hypothetical protein D6Z43_03960 [Pseudomonas sp. DY-1]